MLRTQGGAFAALSDTLVVRQGGRFHTTETVDSLLYRFTGVQTAAHQRNGGGNVFRKDNDTWILVYENKPLRLRHRLGLGYIAELIAKQGRDLHASLHLAVNSGRQSVKPSEGVEVLDDRAVEEFRNRYDDLHDKLAEAERNQDKDRHHDIQNEINVLSKEFAAAMGLGGRGRKVVDVAERHRKSVSNAITRVIDYIEKHHPVLARHLVNSLSLGQYLSYSPEQRVNWDL
jgi:non-specific serine/threonine protein kinase